MNKLNAIVAVNDGKKTSVEKTVTELYHKLQKPELFAGLTRTYKPLSEDGETQPGETKLPQAKVTDVIEEAKKVWAELFDVVATQDHGNTIAKANVVVNGVKVLEDVPVTHLLFLEKRLTDVATFVSKLPVLDPAEQWSFDDSKNVFKTDVTVTNRNLKEPYPFVRAEATDKHPAQVDTLYRDVKVGEWNTVKFSGAVTAKYKQETLDRVKAMIEAVKVAREEANSLEVAKVTEGDKVFKFIFG